MDNQLRNEILTGNKEATKEALKKSFEFNKLDEYGRTILYDLIVKGYDEIVKIIICSLDNVINVKDKEGKTPLHFAVIHFKFLIAKSLIENGAEIDSKDINGNTPLCEAIFYSEGKSEIITLLVKNGANPDIENNYGISPRELSETISNFDVSEFLK